MNRRDVLRGLIGAPIAVVAAPAVTAAPRRVLIQESPVAGFQHHEGESLWLMLSVGTPLELSREPENCHDTRAVAVRFMGRRIGYVPRVENAAVSQMLDRGERLSARLRHLQRDRDPWKRVRFAVELEM